MTWISGEWGQMLMSHLVIKKCTQFFMDLLRQILFSSFIRSSVMNLWTLGCLLRLLKKWEKMNDLSLVVDENDWKFYSKSVLRNEIFTLKNKMRWNPSAIHIKILNFHIFLSHAIVNSTIVRAKNKQTNRQFAIIVSTHFPINF